MCIRDSLKHIFELNIPSFGICLGHQLSALAAGAKTKMCIRDRYTWSATSGSVMMVAGLEFSRTVSMPSAFRARQACVPE